MESQHYAGLGASSSKEGVHKSVGYKAGKSHFSELCSDVCGDPNYQSILHADGAGTKSIVAYLAYRESKDPSWFKGLAQDSLVMNLDDVACVGALESLTLCNTIGRNRFLVNDECISQLIEGYNSTTKQLAEFGIKIKLAGGETADMGDLVRTLVVDSSLFARVQKKSVINFDSVTEGDSIVGFASFGRCIYETDFNSGIGSNGFTLARHALISKAYSEKYPEILCPEIDSDKAYRGKYKLFDAPKPLKQNIARALLSPTRSYTPLIVELQRELKSNIHGLVHCTGGGQAKIINFSKGKRYTKNKLFAVPAIFQLIQESLQVPWPEMYTVFNMGHRLELICPEKYAKTAIQLASELKIEAQVIGFVDEIRGSKNELRIESPFGNFDY